MAAPSARGILNAATARRKKAHPVHALLGELPEQAKPVAARDELDFDPTPPSTTRAILRAEADHMHAHGDTVWENAVGDGRIATVLREFGFQVVGSDITDRGWPGVQVGNFLDFKAPLAPISFTNPPFCEISARDGKGAWLRHSLDLGLGYVGLLLNAQWPFAVINGFVELFNEHPPSIEYLLTWRPDFRGGGQSPMNCCFFVWDDNRPALGPNEWRRTRLFLDDVKAQGALAL